MKLTRIEVKNYRSLFADKGAPTTAVDLAEGMNALVGPNNPIDDVPYISDPDAIDELAAQVAELVRCGQKVAINCMSGLNRSGLLVGRWSSSDMHLSRRWR